MDPDMVNWSDQPIQWKTNYFSIGITLENDSINFDPSTGALNEEWNPFPTAIDFITVARC